MPDPRRAGRNGRKNGDGSFLRGTLLSALLHALAIGLILLAPHRMRAAPPTAYTVEIVDPSALGGKLLAGPIGGGAANARQQRAPRAEPEKPPAPPPPPPQPAKPPEQVAKAEPPKVEPAKPEPPKPEDADAVPLAKATPAPQPTRVAPTARPTVAGRPTTKPTATQVVAKPKATASPAVHVAAKPTASPIALARRPAPTPAPATPPTREAAKEHERAPAGEDLDAKLAAAIKGVESKVEKSGTRGLSGAGPGGGMGGTERTLSGPAGVGGEGPGGGGTLRGLEFVVYYNQMLTRIKESWTYVGTRSDLRVTVRFSILDSGEIKDLRLVERSGDPGYDASVERAIKRVSPLPPPPEAYRKDFSDVELTFRPADLRRPSG